MRASLRVLVPVRDLYQVNPNFIIIITKITEFQRRLRLHEEFAMNQEFKRERLNWTYIPAPMTRNFVPGGPGSEGPCPMVTSSRSPIRCSLNSTDLSLTSMSPGSRYQKRQSIDCVVQALNCIINGEYGVFILFRKSYAIIDRHSAW